MRIRLSSILIALCVALSGPAAPAADRPRPLAVDDHGAVLMLQIRAGEPLRYAIARATGCHDGLPAVEQTPIDATAFERLRERPGVARTIVFVPGYATSVPSDYAAVLRIEERLGPADRVVLVDWGSAGNITEYDHDAHTARRTAPYLAKALVALRAAAPASELDVFAHSLGTRMVAMAIPAFPRRHTPIVANAVLAAPDMTLADYTHAIARLPGPVGHITLYVSRHDRALLISEVFHFRRRLGQITKWSRALAATDVIDASVAGHGRLGHNYATTNPLLIDDIGATLAGAPTPHANWHPRDGAGTTVWEFAPRDGTPIAAWANWCPSVPKAAAFR